MKNKTIILSMLAVAMLAGCTKRGGHTPPNPDPDNGKAAYISIRIDKEITTRASGENDGQGESDLKSLYLVTFDIGDNIVGIPGTSDYYFKIDPPSASPAAIKVSAAAAQLLVIANPGPKLSAVIEAMNSTTTFSTVNTALKSVDHKGITDDVDNITKGFAMINSGDETGKNEGDKIEEGLINIVGKVKVVGENNMTEAQAKTAAEGDRVTIKIERLASKIGLKLKNPVDANGATFSFDKWTLDVVNTTLYPFAEKTLLSVPHTSGSFYEYNFYTRDPNFSANASNGLAKATIGTDYAPVLAAPYGWMAAANKTYSLENTMAAAEQKYGNATRVVLKGAYYPAGYGNTGDWFNFAGVNYNGFSELKTAYNEAKDDSNLKGACDDFYNKVKVYLTANNVDMTNYTEFKDLTEGLLAQVTNGGQVVKNGTLPVIRWYQNGLNYWYYEIRHDNETDVDMAFGKYGVVRNNWYDLTLGTVNGPGTPWFPEVDQPGPGDPDPKDPIDESTGYIGITVDVAPWIIWETEFEI